MAYGTRDHEDDLIEWEARLDEDERQGLFWGDPRRCPTHPQVKTSSEDGMFDGPCWMCEQLIDKAAEREDDGERWCPSCHDSYNIAVGCVCGRDKPPAPIELLADDDIPF